MSDKVVYLTINDVRFTSEVLADRAAYDLMKDMSSLVQSKMSIGEAHLIKPVTTPAVAQDDFVKADQFVACSIRTVVETANEKLNYLQGLNLPAEELGFLLAKMANNQELDRWERAAWQMAHLEMCDQFDLSSDNVSPFPVTNGGFSVANQGDSET